MSTQKSKTKEEISGFAWERIRKILEERHISQVKLRNMCLKKGYRISQPDISKLYSGKISLSLYQLVAFSEVLDISIDYLVNGRSQYGRFQTRGERFIRNPSDDAFKGYLGTFHTVFCSTSPFEENRIVRGKIHFRLSKDKDICETVFELDAGEKNNGKPIIKYYYGQLIISRMGVAYCILANDKIGEIGMIEFRHRDFLINQVESRLGLALTTTAGGKRDPVIHQILLSRYYIRDSELHRITPYLKLEDKDQCLIKKKNVMDCFEECNIEISKLEATSDTEEYMLIDQKILPMINRRLSRSQIAEIEGMLKAMSYSGYHNTIDEEADDAVFDILRTMIYKQNQQNHSSEESDTKAIRNDENK